MQAILYYVTVLMVFKFAKNDIDELNGFINCNLLRIYKLIECKPNIFDEM